MELFKSNTMNEMSLQWLQIDVGPPTLITGVILKSRGDVKNSQYVTRFKLSYSNDTRLWYFYKDAAPLDPRIFDGNNEQITERIHYLATPFIARYVRIHPVIWRSRIAMRVGLLGCKQKGSCTAGFFRINNESSCVPNLAYKKNAWLTPESSNHRKRNLQDSDKASRSYGFTNEARNLIDPENPSHFQYTENQRPPMLAHHRIRDNTANSNAFKFSNIPLWSSINGMTNEQFMGDSSDRMALLAVDGWTGEEILLKNSTLSTRSSERLMNDAPDNKQLTNDSLNKRSIQNVLHTTSMIQKSAHPCTILEYRWPFVELPSWYVDLREHIEVKGVVIYTAGHGRDGRYLLSSLFGSDDKTKFNSENLERLSIYVESEPRHHDTKALSRSSSSLCGFVTRINDAIFSPRLHIPCRQPLVGRYVYVEARGVRGRWSQEFAALLCANCACLVSKQRLRRAGCICDRILEITKSSTIEKDTIEIRQLSPGFKWPTELLNPTKSQPNTTLYLLTEFLELQLDDGNLEPIFGSAFIYDVHSRLKVSETFHFDTNSTRMMNLFSGSMTNQQLAYRDVTSLVQACLFRISSRYNLSNSTDLRSNITKSYLKTPSGGSAEKIGVHSNVLTNDCESNNDDDFGLEDVLLFASEWTEKPHFNSCKTSCCKGGLFLIIRVS
ncbi:unnamed protein product [Schistosoma margrebowiei]|uniref:Uncharacterized protein n=1 Tax=Schistosoma margrebowiei TaxID=48269 RepID=A0A183LNJ2_9TREM|nr:unnamed protein product [Schistosoma margrebowiei]